MRTIITFPDGTRIIFSGMNLRQSSAAHIYLNDGIKSSVSIFPNYENYGKPIEVEVYQEEKE